MVIGMYTCRHVNKQDIHKSVCLHVLVYVFMHISIYLGRVSGRHVYTYVHTYTQVDMHEHICVYIYT